MQNLPQEKNAVESDAFHTLKVRSDELDKFKAIVTGDRRNYVANIIFTIILPEYSEEACGRVESDDEQRLNNEVFTHATCELFSILRSWEDDGVQRPIRLDLHDTHSPTDMRMDNFEALRQLKLQVMRHERDDILGKRYRTSFLRLLPNCTLPELHNVHQLDMHNYGTDEDEDPIERMLAPDVGPALAASLPNLQKIVWEFDDWVRQAAYVRQAHRFEFAKALKEVHIQPRASARIDFVHGTYYPDQRRVFESLNQGFSYDPFSASLRTFSQNLTSFTVNAHLDSTLFWPSKDEKNVPTPTWPFLKTLEVSFSMVAPCGDWYYTGTRPADHKDDDPENEVIGDPRNGTDYSNYRANPDPATFDGFLGAFAKAVQKMPVLEHFTLRCELGNGKGYLVIRYYAPGLPSNGVEREGHRDGVQVRRVYYELGNGKKWRPNNEILSGIRGVGREKFGDKVIERFIKSQYILR